MTADGSVHRFGLEATPARRNVRKLLESDVARSIRADLGDAACRTGINAQRGKITTEKDRQTRERRRRTDNHEHEDDEVRKHADETEDVQLGLESGQVGVADDVHLIGVEEGRAGE